MNYYPHHIGDYARDTAHLSALEDGIYRRMLDLYYATEKPLTNDRAQLCRLLRIKGRECKTVDALLREFFDPSDDGWKHGRCDAEIAKAQDKRIKASASAELRWQSGRNAKASRKKMRTHSEGNAPNNQEPIANNQETTKPLASRDESRSAANGSCVAYIPLNDGTEFGITEGFCKELDRLYPAVDALQTLNEIRAWNLANPTRRKTKSGVMRHVNSWFSRLQDKAP